MAKKTSSVSRFSSLLNDVDKGQLDAVYNKTEVPASATEEKTVGASPVLQEEETVVPEQNDNDIQEKEKNGKKELENVGKGEKRKKGKEEKRSAGVSYKLTKESDKAVFILTNSGEFPVRGKNEMVDYIISKFIEKKNVREILDQGIKW